MEAGTPGVGAGRHDHGGGVLRPGDNHSRPGIRRGWLAFACIAGAAVLRYVATRLG
jgi:hypothetical protein